MLYSPLALPGASEDRPPPPSGHRTLGPSSHGDHQEMATATPEISVPRPPPESLLESSQGTDRPCNSAPSSRPQPLAGGQTDRHFALFHWLRAQCPWLACAPGVAEPTKIQATPGFQPRLPRPVLSPRERKAGKLGSPEPASEAGLRRWGAGGVERAAPAHWWLGDLGCSALAIAGWASAHQLPGQRFHSAPRQGLGTGSNPRIGSAFSNWAQRPGLEQFNRSHWSLKKKKKNPGLNPEPDK